MFFKSQTLGILGSFLVAAAMVLMLASSALAQEWSDAQIDSLANHAEATVQKAFACLWDYRVKNGIADTTRDPRHTGVIGVEYTVLTTTVGYEDAKDLSTQPGWASWLVRELAKRGLWQRAKVAVSFSGSFPGLNIAVLAALQEFDANVSGICSIGASSYGANELGLSYPEMERMLREEGLLTVGCGAVTLGGTGDHGAEFNEYAAEQAMTAVKRCRLPLINSINLKDAIKKRLLYYRLLEDYVIYINVGGNHAVMGGGPKMRYSVGGWYFESPREQGEPNGVLDAFLKKQIPCLHFLRLDDLSTQYHIVQILAEDE